MLLGFPQDRADNVADVLELVFSSCCGGCAHGSAPLVSSDSVRFGVLTRERLYDEQHVCVCRMKSI